MLLGGLEGAGHSCCYCNIFKGKTLVLIPMATVTREHQFSALKQHRYVDLLFWGLKSRCGQGCVSCGDPGEPPPCLPSFWTCLHSLARGSSIFRASHGGSVFLQLYGPHSDTSPPPPPSLTYKDPRDDAGPSSLSKRDSSSQDQLMSNVNSSAPLAPLLCNMRYSQVWGFGCRCP